MMAKPAAATGKAPPRPPAGPFGRRAIAAQQGQILRAALAAVGPERPTAAFDLDSTLLSNKRRQARIVREFGAAHGDARLAACTEECVVSWELRDTAMLCGVPEPELDDLLPPLRSFWQERFFTSAFCADDEPLPGAAAFLRAVLARGGHLLYLTGRPQDMRDGTLAAFRRAGFPMPREAGAGGAAGPGDVDLWLKPVRAGDDDAWKDECHARLVAMSAVACAFDNEPTHVNAYKRAFPDAVVVHLDTDHSQRPVEVLESIPSILDFRLDPVAAGTSCVASGEGRR
jgi:beta-phosphoglucomutase-like phosphatase (HAD superfamily)